MCEPFLPTRQLRPIHLSKCVTCEWAGSSAVEGIASASDLNNSAAHWLPLNITDKCYHLLVIADCLKVIC